MTWSNTLSLVQERESWFWWWQYCIYSSCL